MHVDRFYATADGGSAFEDLEISVEQFGEDAWGNKLGTAFHFDSPSVQLFEIEAGAFQDWHHAPRRQLCIVLAGIWQVRTSDGEARQWGPGMAFLPDDMTGQGHQSKVVDGPVKILFVPLPDSLDLTPYRSSSSNDA